MKPIRRPKGRKSRKGSFALPIVMIAGVIYIFTAQKPVETALKQIAPLIQKKSLPAKAEDPEINASIEAAPATLAVDLNQRRTKLIGNSQAGISTLEIKAVDGFITVPIQFLPKTVWCQGGDIDTMRYALSDPSEKNILLSLESLDKDARSASVKISLEDLLKGYKHDFKFKTRGGSENLGVFICKSSKDEKSCQAKTMKTHEELSKLLSDEQTAEDAKKQDYLFYFQSLVFAKSGVSVFKANDYLGKEPSALKNQFEAQFDLSESDFKKSWQFSSTLKSLPAEVKGKSIVLNLLYNDPRCNAKASN